MREFLCFHRYSGICGDREGNSEIFMNEHASNLFHVRCRIPESKEELLAYIQRFMEENDEKKLREYREYITRAF